MYGMQYIFKELSLFHLKMKVYMFNAKKKKKQLRFESCGPKEKWSCFFALLTGSGRRQRQAASCRAEWEDRDEGSNEFVSLVMKCVTLAVTAYLTSEYRHCLAVFEHFLATDEFIYFHWERKRTQFDLEQLSVSELIKSVYL